MDRAYASVVNIPSKQAATDMHNIVLVWINIDNFKQFTRCFKSTSYP